MEYMNVHAHDAHAFAFAFAYAQGALPTSPGGFDSHNIDDDVDLKRKSGR